MNDDQKKQQILSNCQTIAVVGLSGNPQKTSYRIAEYLQSAGYRIVPINPHVDEVLGEKAYPNLKSVPFTVDLVDVFRKQEDIQAVVNEAIAAKPQAIWLQLGLKYDGDKDLSEAQTELIENCCIMVEHRRLMA